MANLFIRNEPYVQLNGISHGTHISNTDVEGALAFAARMGRVAVTVTECPGIFECACIETAIAINDIDFPFILTA